MDSSGEYGIPILLGIIEGLTEFIPVSSTGHLILFGEALTYHGPAAETFEVFIQLGAILAVLFLYPNRFLHLLRFNSSGGFSGWQGITKLCLACLPAFVLGFLLHSIIKGMLFRPIPVAIALIVGGVALIGIERKTLKSPVSSLEDISFRQSFLIGCFQTLALWPGISRSGATIIGGIWLGLERTVAAEFSFLVAVPVMFAATLFDLYKNMGSLGEGAFTELSTGFVVSFVVALIAIRTFIGFLKKFSLASFGWYRILLGVIVLLVLR
ncbi:undecaprenyl-diphosphate phosphatase [bacterium]|nr:undecaprenyl-diphosphate phosphatase [bacterium]